MTQQPIAEARYNASQVADYFIWLSSQKEVEEGGVVEGVTPLKLQKLLYFAQAASLALYNKKLFTEEIQAWKYGPVVPNLYHQYKDHLNHPITKARGNYSEIDDEETQELIQGVWELFDKYSSGELVEITHQHEPWKSVFKEGENKVIPVEIIKEYYKDTFVLEDYDDQED